MGCGAVSVRSDLMALPARHAACRWAFPARLAPQGDQQDEKPCSDITRTIQDYTGGESNQSFVDDVVDNFVNVKDTAASTVLGAGASIVGGGTASKAYAGLLAGSIIRTGINRAATAACGRPGPGP